MSEIEEKRKHISVAEMEEILNPCLCDSVEELGKRLANPVKFRRAAIKKKSFDVIIHEDGRYEFIETTGQEWDESE